MMSDYEYTEKLIEHYKVLIHPGDDGMSRDEAFELFAICVTLGKRGFTQTDDEEDWLPPFTPDAE